MLLDWQYPNTQCNLVQDSAISLLLVQFNAIKVMRQRF